MTATYDIETLKHHVGSEIYVSDWTTVGQSEIDEFARVTRDSDPMHVDPEFARTHSPFGTTVLFGHWSTLGRVHWPEYGVYGLDTGAVWGRSLTALRLDDRKLISVGCPELRKPDEDG